MNIYAIILLVTFSRKRKILKKSMTPSVMNQLVNYFLTEKINCICTAVADFSSAVLPVLLSRFSLLTSYTFRLSNLEGLEE